MVRLSPEVNSPPMSRNLSTDDRHCTYSVRNCGRLCKSLTDYSATVASPTHWDESSLKLRHHYDVAASLQSDLGCSVAYPLPGGV